MISSEHTGKCAAAGLLVLLLLGPAHLSQAAAITTAADGGSTLSGSAAAEAVVHVGQKGNVTCTYLEGGYEVKCGAKVYTHEGDMPPWTTNSYVFLGVSIGLVLFAGLMSGLTMGLMSLDNTTLTILSKQGKPAEQKYAAKIIPLTERHHLLLVTLLLWNACAMEALPIFLDKIVSEVLAIVLSVTFVLFFGEVIPQAICTRYGLAIGANLAPFVYFLMFIMFPIAYPIAKLLDCILGHEAGTFYRRAELGELVNLHAQTDIEDNEEPLTADECMIIKGALELTGKTAADAMTPIEDTFMVNYDGVWDRTLMETVITKGHSRIPVYRYSRQNVVGVVLVKQLILLDPDAAEPVAHSVKSAIMEVEPDIQLYALLNIFQTGRSHIALVRHVKSGDGGGPVEGETEEQARARELAEDQRAQAGVGNVTENEEVLGVITLEDVIEDLLQEEIYDETDAERDHTHLRVQAARLMRRVSKVGHAIQRANSAEHGYAISISPHNRKRAGSVKFQAVGRSSLGAVGGSSTVGSVNNSHSTDVHTSERSPLLKKH